MNSFLQASKLPSLRLLMVFLTALLAGCVSSPREASEVQGAESVPPALSLSKPAVEQAPLEYPVAAFPQDSLYQLLVAEVAGYRGDFATAMEKYLEMAVETRDPGVASRATRLAVYLQDDAAALAAARIWVEVEPDSLDAQRQAASQLIRVGDLEQAIVHMAAIRALGGVANFDVFAYHSAELDQSARDGLLAAVDRMLQDYPADSQLLFSQAVLLEQNGRFAEALEITDRLLLSESNVNIVILKVNILKNSDRVPQALRFLAARLDSQEDNRRTRLIYARLLFESDRLEDARQQYELVLKQTPKDGDILLALALIALEQDHFRVAQEYLMQMLRWDQRVGEAHFYLGNVAEQENDWVTAVREYKLAGGGYEYLPAQARIASILIDQQRTSEALKHLAKQRRDHPEHFQPLIMIEVQLLGEYGLGDELFALLDHIIAQDPDNIELLYYRAMAGERFDRLDILERDLLRVLVLDPENADAMNALGYSLADQTDRYAEALALIQRALQIKPQEAAFIDSLGWVQYRLQNYEEAVILLRRALALFENDEVAAHLGEVLWMLGEQAEALEIWNKALELVPDSGPLNQVIERFTQP